ncbi:hypothetical protein [Botrimarina hoheduenensis]|uniref:Uncharacterized protein n=1 Tax=Botrimarina hoheduenensis TaxID=2528000 RepID=A0A5C5WCS8_9BACT|nr:hypothetical protein [Botrimarina hoheduenensis]TWT48480.1 hypothetical protein Pla111_02480 [Botrimarina hoheduenensis]
MKGLKLFLGDTWWVFGLACVMACALGYASDMWIMYLFPVVCVPVAVYMAAVRYNSQGDPRSERDQRPSDR